MHIETGFHEREPGILRITLLEGAELLHRRIRSAYRDMHGAQGGGRRGEEQEWWVARRTASSRGLSGTCTAIRHASMHEEGY